MALDYDKLIAPISDEAPCGPDLRAEPAFRDIEDAPGEFAGMGPADLKKIVGRCAEFLEKTHDQAPAIVAAQAAARAGDFAEAATALRIVKAFADDYWEDFHPGPAEEMAIGRINELSALSRPAALILPIQRAAIARLPAPSTVEFTAGMLRQAASPVLEWTDEDEERLGTQVSSGAITAANAKTAKATHDGARTLRLIMRSIAPSALSADVAAGAGSDPVEGGPALATTLRAQVAGAAEPFRAISDVLYDLMDLYSSKASDSPSFGPILSQIKQTIESIDLFLEAFPDPAATAAAADDGAEAASIGPGDGDVAVGPGVAARPRTFVADTPRSRTDVNAAIEAICRFYAENEPASPVPLMLRRIQRWVNKDFLQLLEEISPSGFEEASKLLATTDG